MGKLHQEAVYLFIKLLELEEVVTAVNKFYDRLPKILCFRRPGLEKLIESSLRRITHAIMFSPHKEEKNRLPVKIDLVKYFFPVDELQSIRVNLSPQHPSVSDENSIIRDLLLIVNKGITTFQEFPAYQVLVSLSFTNEGILKEKIQRKVEEISSSEQPFPLQPAIEGEREFREKIKKYEKIDLPQMRATALVLYGLSFDLHNLFLGEFTNEGIQKAIYIGIRKMFTREPLLGVFSTLKGHYGYETIKEEKRKYLAGKKSHIEKRLYFLLSLWGWQQGVNLGSYTNNEEAHREVINLKIKELKTKEFLDYNFCEDYQGYIQRIKQKKDLGSVICAALSQILKETNSSDIMGYPHILNILMEQSSGKLVSMLSHSQFRNYLKSNKMKKGDFTPLYKIFCKDKSLFEEVYPLITTPEDKFVSSLARLIDNFDGDISGIKITEKMKKFVVNLSEYNQENIKEIICVLQHFPYAQRALSLGYSSFPPDIEKIENKVEFAKWFFKNKSVLLEKLTYSSAVEPYLKGSKSFQLREKLIQLWQKHGEEFCRKHLEELRCYGEVTHYLSEQAYLRIIDTLLSLTYAPRLCRKREFVKILQYISSVASQSQWKKFSAKLVQIDGKTLNDYKELFEEYRGEIILKVMNSKVDLLQAKILVDTYINAKEERQVKLVERLIEFLSKKIVCLEVVKNICDHITNRHYALGEFGVTQLQKGKSYQEVLKILEVYKNDDEFGKTPPNELFK